MNAPPNEIQTEPRPNCFLCGSRGQPLYRDLPSALFETAGRWNFSQCLRNECGLVWINPTPIEADLHLAYETYFTHDDGQSPSAAKPKTRDRLYALYRAFNLPGFWICGITREKSRREQMFLDEVKPGKLLDVGCGDGKFLSKMQARGWSVDGIDFDGHAIKTAEQRYGLTLRHGDLRQVGLAEESFDAVTMSHVIEHVTDPIGLLSEIRRLLKPGGHLAITTPNVGALGHRKFGPCWFGVDAPRHLNLFTADALSQVAQRAGFGAIKTNSTSANADIFFGASYTTQDQQGHRMGHQPTPNVWRTIKAACWQYREHFAVRKDPDCGEELVMVCTKN